MSTTYLGIDYWPFMVNFFESNAIELIEAQYGIKSNGAVIKLLCKIFKEGYYIYWGDEEAIIFTRKLGGDVNAREMKGMIDILLNKDFFDKESYDKHRILTSVEIQRIWLEATSRRKIDALSQPYLLAQSFKRRKEVGSSEDDSNLPKNVDTNPEIDHILTENADISEQSKVKKRKEQQRIAENEEEDNTASPLFEIPEYARNTRTHNVKGLLASLVQHKVTCEKETITILKLSDYGRKGTQIWLTLSSTNWTKIDNPGRYIISTLKR